MNKKNKKFVSRFPLLEAFREKESQKAQKYWLETGTSIYRGYVREKPKSKKEYLDKWLGYFPDMTAIDDERIGRLVGPFYIGIILITEDIRNGIKQRLYVSNMCELEVKTKFTVCETMATIPIEYDWPEELFQECVDIIKQDFYIHTEGDITLDDIFNFFMKLKDNCYGYLTTQSSIAPILIATWAGESKKAMEYYEWLKDWRQSPACRTSKYSEDDTITIQEDTDILLADLQELMKQPEKLRYNVIESIKALKLEKATYQDIAGVSYKESYFQK